MNPSPKFLWSAVAAFAWALPVSAAVIFDNGGPVVGITAISDVGTTLRAADDFILQDGANTITDIHWWGIYYFDDSPQPQDVFTLSIFAVDNALNVSTVFSETTSQVSRSDTGVDLYTRDIYAYSVDIAALVLEPGLRYWISIANDTREDTDDAWNWVFSEHIGTTLMSIDSGAHWGYGGGELAFYLTDDGLSSSDVVPEPATMTLLGLGLVGLAYRQRKRQI